MSMRKDYIDVEKMTASVFQNVSRLKILLSSKPQKSIEVSFRMTNVKLEKII